VRAACSASRAAVAPSSHDAPDPHGAAPPGRSGPARSERASGGGGIRTHETLAGLPVFKVRNRVCTLQRFAPKCSGDGRFGARRIAAPCSLAPLYRDRIRDRYRQARKTPSAWRIAETKGLAAHGPDRSVD